MQCVRAYAHVCEAQRCRGRNRRVLLGTMVAAVAAAVAMPAAAPAAGPTSVTVRVATSSQKALLKEGLAVRLAATGRAAVTVSARRGTKTGAFTTRKVRFSRRGTKVVHLALTRSGRRALGACGVPRLRAAIAYARTTGTGRHRRTRTVRASRTRTLAADRTRCHTTPPGPRPPAPPGDAPAPVAPLHVEPAGGAHCDPIDPASCMLPYPNDFLTVADPTTPTGRRIAFDEADTPANRGGTHVAVAEYNRNDGFSPNNTILTRIPGFDAPGILTANGIVTQSDIGQYARPDQPVVLIDTTTHQRVPIWTELDMVPGSPTNPTGDAGSRLTIVHPAVALDGGRRYVVAFRHLVDGTGAPIAPNPIFRALRDDVPTDSARVEARRPAMTRIFGDLEQAGIGRSDLHLAWDFTVGSDQSITGRLRAMRDQAFAALGDTDLADGVVQGQAPAIHDVQVHPYALCDHDGNATCSHSESDYDIARITGTIEVPCFMDGPSDEGLADQAPCAPGSRLHYADGADVPSANGSATYEAPFTCLLPRTSKGAATAGTHRPAVVFGHGLLGDHTQTEELRSFPAATAAVACGTDWIGMSSGDLSTFLPTMLVDLGRFPALVDRSQQGIVNVLYLARAMAASAAQGGLGGLAAFRDGGEPTLEPGRVGYLGISQGGIFGGAATAVAPDWTRAVLGVPGMGFSTLLTRSTQFNRFLPIIYAVYPDPTERTIGISMLQLLWDRGEASGYVHHLTSDPPPNTPAHKVLLQEAFGDHQVTNVQTEAQARTMGAVVRTPTLAPGRSLLDVPLWGIAPAPSSTFTQPGGYQGDAALFVLDTGPIRLDPALGVFVGTNANPLINVAPFDATVGPDPANPVPKSDPGQARDGLDPHEPVATSPNAQAMLTPFLSYTTGMGDPCTSAGTPVPCAAPPVHTLGEGL